jgi:hypothetical protein
MLLLLKILVGKNGVNAIVIGGDNDRRCEPAAGAFI